MKDFMMIWNCITDRRYASVEVTNNQSDTSESEEINSTQTPNGLRRNRIFDGASPDRSENLRRSRSILMLMTLGFLSLTFASLVLTLQPYDFLFKLKVAFGKGGEIFDIWRKPKVDLYLKVYLFNVTNRDEYLSGAESKLRFKEVGPYVYKEGLEHGNVHFNTNGTLTAVPYHPLTYVPEMSNGTEEDVLMLPNIALLSITNVMRDASYFTRWGMNMIIHRTDSQPLVKMTTREFMFGYESPLVTIGNKFMPAWIKFDKLGLIDRMYDFDGDYETVYTGETDIRKTGLIEKYNGDYNLPQWTGKCANINEASDGAKFPSYVQPNDTVLFFRKSLCRSARLVRIGERNIKGLHSYQYKFMENELDNGAINPENKCFCRQGYCLKPGLIDVTDCYYGFPIALSYPHFYKADPSILDAVEGLQPDPELHESFLFFEPKSGLPLSLAFRFQINMALQNIGHMAKVEKFENTVLPLLWFEISLHELPDSMNLRFWIYLTFLPMLQDVLMYILFVSSVLLIIWGLYKVLLNPPRMTTINRQWHDTELDKKMHNYLNTRRLSNKTKEMDTYYSSLLDSKEANGVTTELSSLKEDIV